MRHLGGPSDDPADTDEALARWARHWDEHGFGLVAAELRETGRLVARGGPQFHRAWPHDPEIGWAVDPAEWGQGIATEFGAACVEWTLGPLGFRRVVSIATAENVASLAVMARLGFEPHAEVEDPTLHLPLLVHVRER